MDANITAITIEWWFNGPAPGSAITHEKTSVSIPKCTATTKRIRGTGETVATYIYAINQERLQRFLTMFKPELDYVVDKADYKVEVCDGSSWTMVVTYSDKTRKKLQGNIELPPFGAWLEDEIRSLLPVEVAVYNPILFGCR